MMKRIAVLLAFLMTIGSQVTAANEDSAPSTGYLKYVCNGETHIIVSTEAGWAAPSRPNVTVETTYDGFMLTDREIWTGKVTWKISFRSKLYVRLSRRWHETV